MKFPVQIILDFLYQKSLTVVGVFVFVRNRLLTNICTTKLFVVGAFCTVD